MNVLGLTLSSNLFRNCEFCFNSYFVEIKKILWSITKKKDLQKNEKKIPEILCEGENGNEKRRNEIEIKFKNENKKNIYQKKNFKEFNDIRVRQIRLKSRIGNKE